MKQSRSIILMMACMLASCAQSRASPTTPHQAPSGSETATATPAFQTLAEFERALDIAVNSDAIDSFWEAIVAAGQMPLTFGETAVFMYRGDANAVAWGADFSPGDPWLVYMRGERQGNTDLWLLKRRFPIDARFNYRILLNGDEKTILDPLNPFQNMEGSGLASELRMPDYDPPETVVPRDDIAHGTLSDALTLLSQVRGYKVNYCVYTPAGYENMADLATLYVVDGQEYARDDLGSMVIVLDNLIADGAIKPLIVVFIDQRDPYTGHTRRDEEFFSPRYEEFLVTELVPTIDAAYRTTPAPEARAILGASSGGVFATHVGLNHPDAFHLIALQSPAPNLALEDYDRLQKARDTLPLKFFISVGTIGDFTRPTRLLHEILLAEGYPHRYIETNDGHAWGNYRALLDDLLIYFFGGGNASNQ